MSDTIEDKTITTDVVISKALTPAVIFSPGNIDKVIAAIEAEVAKFKADPASEEGRELIRAMAYKVTRSKTALDKMGKDLTEEWRTRTSAVNAERKIVDTQLSALAEKVRKPLTDYEAMEKNRIAGHEAALLEIAPWSPSEQGTIAEISDRLDYLRSYPQRDWQEFSIRADRVLTDEIARVETLLKVAQQRESDAEELRQLRAAQAERDRLAEIQAKKEREERIAAAAAEAARTEAEAKAAREAKEAEERAQAAIREAEQKAEAERWAAAERFAKAEREKQEAAEAAERELQRAADHAAMIQAKAERDAKDAADRQRAIEEREKLAAQQAEVARKYAEAKAKADQEAAVQAERDRQAREEAGRKAEEAQRAANKAHVETINREIIFDLTAAGATEKTAKAIIAAIVKAKVRHVSIQY